jgi:hypothetical protein
LWHSNELPGFYIRERNLPIKERERERWRGGEVERWRGGEVEKCGVGMQQAVCVREMWCWHAAGCLC